MSATDIPQNVADQIAQIALPCLHNTFNPRGLVDCTTAYVKKRHWQSGVAASGTLAPDNALRCTSITFLGSGTFHYVYKLCFSDGTELAASISNQTERTFSSEIMKSEIATMKYVRESGLYPDVPVPEVHAWDTTFKNPAGVPYIFMDVVKGVVIDNSQAQGQARFVQAFDVYPKDKQLAIVKALARLQAALSKPVPFDRLGAMALDDTAPGGYRLGPLLGFGDDDGANVGESFKSTQDLWYWQLEQLMEGAPEEWCSLDTDFLCEDSSRINQTPQTFSNTYRQLCALVPHFKIPKPYDILVLHHPDIALRNVFFDEESLTSGTPKITGVIDWSGAEILPLMLTAIYPGDLMSNDTTPFRPLFKHPLERDYTWWRSVPYGWTSLGDPSKYAVDDNRGYWGGNEKHDYTQPLSARVRRFYLRTYFSACYASQMFDLHGDHNLARATLFSDATYYLKFHSAICISVEGWSTLQSWIDDTYWRLGSIGGAESKPGEAKDDPPLVVGPNVYKGPLPRPVRDLRMLPEEADDWGVKSVDRD